MFPKYVNFTADSLPVAKAEELADGASSDLDIISSVYNYIITHTTSATHNQTPATEAASHTDPPHRYLPRRQTAPKLLQQILQLLISPTRKKDILWQNTPVPMQNPNCS